jgi:high frequency lysogenization protein
LSNTDDQVLALSGIFQAAYLVTKIARTGIHPQDSFESSINSLFVFDADNTSQIFDGRSNLMVGLRLSSEILDKKGPSVGAGENFDIFRYGLSLLQLERKLAGQTGMLDFIGQRLEEIARQANHFSVTHPQVIGNIAELYQDTLSSLPLRIQVRGESRFLQNDTNVNKVRALLLAGIRSSVLWHQLGGRRRHLVFSRARLRHSVQQQIDLIAQLH